MVGRWWDDETAAAIDSLQQRRARDAARRGPGDVPRHVLHHRPDGDWAPLLPLLVAEREAGWRVTTTSVPGPGADRLDEAGIPHVPLGRAGRRRWPRARGLRAALRLRRVLTRLQPDVLHTHGRGSVGRVVGRTSRAVGAVVHTVEGLEDLADAGWLRQVRRYLAERFAAMWSHVELVRSREDLETLAPVGVAGETLRYVGTGIDLTRFAPDRSDLRSRSAVRAELGADAESLVVGAAGRLAHGQGWPVLLGAFRDVCSKRDDVRLVVVGAHRAGEPDALPGVVIERAKADGVVFLGERDDLEALLVGLDCFVLTGRSEERALLAMQAAAMGVPVLAPAGGRHRELVEHGRTGELYPPHKPSTLAYALARAASDRRRLEALAAGARRKAEREFDVRQQAERTLAAYADALGS